MSPSRKKLNYALMISVFAVWGIILFRIISVEIGGNQIVSEDVGDENLNVLMVAADSKIDSFQIISLYRNPFEKEQIIKKEMKIKSKRDTSENKIIAFNYKINGVIINSKRKVIILEDIDSNKTVFLRENDSYRGIRINSILKNEIILTGQTGRLTLPINPK